MPTYLYFGRGSRSPGPAPDAESLLDALADQVLDEPDVGAALAALQKRGFPLQDGRRHPGTNDLAKSIRNRQRALRKQHSFEALTRDFAQRYRDALRSELDATEQHFAGRARARSEALDEWQQRLRRLGEHAGGTPAEGGKRMTPHGAEAEYEDLFLRINEALDEARADQEAERARLERLEHLPVQPVEAVQEIEDYDFLSDDAARAVDGLNAMRSQIAELVASEARHAFTGEEVPDAGAAAKIARKMRDLDTLEGQLRGGRVRHIDPERVGAWLGRPARTAVEGLQHVADVLREAGYLLDQAGNVRLSPRAIRRLGQRALREMFTELKRSGPGEHETGLVGTGPSQGATVRPIESGDPFDIHLNATLLRAATRTPTVPLRLLPTDFMVHQTEAAVYSATVLMIDVSYTMMRHGRILAAKKVALALDTLIRTKFPKDTLELVAFSSLARPLELAELPNVRPRLGQPFTNMQDGLQLATRLLRRHRGANRQIIMITDGEPTAVVQADGRVRSCYPPDEHIFETTLEAVRAASAHGITINVVMLAENPDLIEFVRRMAHINRGRALVSTPATLGQYVIYDYLRGKRLALAA